MATARLRPITVADADLCFRWVSDPDVARHLGVTQTPRSVKQEWSWISAVLASHGQQRIFIIEDEMGRPIGTCSLRGLDSSEGAARFGIMIGDKRRWGQGYGTAATRAALALAFGELGLRAVQLSCHSENRRALRCYEKAGFRRIEPNPLRPDEVRMAITREEWAARSEGQVQ